MVLEQLQGRMREGRIRHRRQPGGAAVGAEPTPQQTEIAGAWSS